MSGAVSGEDNAAPPGRGGNEGSAHSKGRLSYTWAIFEEVWNFNRRVLMVAVPYIIVAIVLVALGAGGVSPAAGAVGIALFALLIAVILHRWLWMRLVVPWYHGKRVPLWVRVTLWVFLLIFYGVAISGPLVIDAGIVSPSHLEPNWYTMLSSSISACLFALLVALALVDLAVLLFYMCIYLVSLCSKRVSSSTRAAGGLIPYFLPPIAVLCVTAILIIVAFVNGFSDPGVKTIIVPLDGVGPCLDGYKMAMISDLHLGPTVGQKELIRHVQATNNLGADVIVIVGDMIDAKIEEIGEMGLPMANLTAPDGVFLTLGNHEHYTDEVPQWISYFGDRGFRVLMNERVQVTSSRRFTGNVTAEECTFELAGVDDYEGAPNYESALGGRTNTNLPLILMAHQPRQVNDATSTSTSQIGMGYGVGLQLSGHTHGGQFWPLHGLSLINQEYVAGLFQRHNPPINATSTSSSRNVLRNLDLPDRSSEPPSMIDTLPSKIAARLHALADHPRPFTQSEDTSASLSTYSEKNTTVVSSTSGSGALTLAAAVGSSVSDLLLYVSSGTVGWGPRVRVLSWTEYTLIEFRTPGTVEPNVKLSPAQRASIAAIVLYVVAIIALIGVVVGGEIIGAKRRVDAREGARLPQQTEVPV